MKRRKRERTIDEVIIKNSTFERMLRWLDRAKREVDEDE